MEKKTERPNNRGGARPGSGRKKTGLKTKNYTIHLPVDLAEKMEIRAAQLNITVNRYLRNIIESSGKYSNVNVQSKLADDGINGDGLYID